MADDWSNLADDEVKQPVIPKPLPVAAVNKWAGEDEDDDIKDSWDAEDEDDEKKDQEKNAPVVAVKPKKNLQQKIAEKEKQRLELEEKRRKEREAMENMTPEERIAEKLRLKKEEEEAYMETALDSLGLKSTTKVDSLNPSTKEDFKELAEHFCKKVADYKNKEELVDVLSEMVKQLCAGFSATNIKTIKSAVDSVLTEKTKLEKNKKKPAAKAKGGVRLERDDDYTSQAGAYEADDYDDFM